MAAAALWLLVTWMRRRLAGYTGDCCGATFLVVELVDRAIHNANKFFRKLGSQKKRYDSLDRIILREKDFR